MPTSQKSPPALVLAVALGLLSLPSARANEPAANFRILIANTPQSFGDPTKELVGCSADGAVLAGHTQSVLSRSGEPFRLVDGTFETLAAAPGFPTDAYAAAISGDGLVIVGNTLTPHSRTNEPPTIGFFPEDRSDTVTQGGAFRWTAATGMQPLFVPPNRNSFATAVSTDGSVIAGSYRIYTSPTGPDFIHRGFRWTAEGVTQLDPLPGYPQAHATGISGDGAIVIGSSTGSNSASEASRWAADGTVTSLGTLPASDPTITPTGVRSVATAISADGSVVIGTSAFSYVIDNYHRTSGERPFRWTADGGLQPLPIIGVPRALSTDGSVIASDDNFNVYRWDAQRGSQNIRDLLIAAGIDLRHLRLDKVIAISADGRTFFGEGHYDFFIDRTGYGTGSIFTQGPSPFFFWTATLPLVQELPDPDPVVDPTIFETQAPPAPALDRNIETAPLPGRPHRILIRGNASGPVTRVTYRVGSSGSFQRANGSASWRFTTRLEPGRNVITIRAHGPGGRSKSVKIIRARR